MSHYVEKQHSCVSCGCVFRYRMDTQSTQFTLMKVASHPCPGCGLFQPEMVMWSKVWLPICTFATLFAVIVMGAVCTARDGVSPTTATYLGIGLFSLLAFFQLGTVFANPNADRAANLALAEQEIQSRKLEMVSNPTTDTPAPGPRNFPFLHALGIPLLLAGPAGFFYPILYPPKEVEIPKNPDLKPSVVTAGDQVEFTFTRHKLEGITGTIWKGTPTVRVQNAKELGITETLVSEGNNTDYGSSFKAPRGSRNQPLRPTIRFTIPKGEKLAGKTLRLALTMPVTFPADNGSDWSGSHYFKDQSATVSDTLPVKLADETAIAEVRRILMTSLCIAAISLIGSLWFACLAWRLQAYASASEVMLPNYATEPVGFAAMPWEAPPVGKEALEKIDRSMWGNRKLRG
jgi:hypothetical protein